MLLALVLVRIVVVAGLRLVLMSEVAVMARTDEVVRVDRAPTEVRRLVRLLTLAAVLALAYRVVGPGSTRWDHALGGDGTSERIGSKGLMHIPVLVLRLCDGLRVCLARVTVLLRGKFVRGNHAHRHRAVVPLPALMLAWRINLMEAMEVALPATSVTRRLSIVVRVIVLRNGDKRPIEARSNDSALNLVLMMVVACDGTILATSANIAEVERRGDTLLVV
mmetsp:Transcript_6403/g.8560  ORF Transcript_6403/g.8560 Transcript_6403/m.8560 type:complete len:221 (-) Transcript_6403:66-728(-)